MHFHVGLIDFLIWCANAVIFNFFVRQLAALYPDSTFGKAVAYVAV